MNEVKEQLAKMIPLYCDELENVDILKYGDIEFSDEFEKKMEKLIRIRKKKYYPLIKTTGRKIATAIAAAAILGTVTVAAYAPARKAIKNFIVEVFAHYSVVSSEKTDGHKDTIEHIYTLDVPEGFVVNEEDFAKTDYFVQNSYYTQDKSRFLFFEQFTKKYYQSYYDNEEKQLEKLTSENGNNYIKYNNGDNVIILWDSGEYIFKLGGNITEKELMDIYQSFCDDNSMNE